MLKHQTKTFFPSIQLEFLLLHLEAVSPRAITNFLGEEAAHPPSIIYFAPSERSTLNCGCLNSPGCVPALLEDGVLPA